jgi:hypothetical protein
MSRIDELIAEVRNDLNKYDAAGLIDEVSVTRDIVKGLRRFGNAVTELHETVLELENGRATLPENFHNLLLAALCEPVGYKKFSTDSLITSHFYKEKTIRKQVWNECDSCCSETSESLIRENVYFDGQNAEFFYKNPTILSLGKTINKNVYNEKCRNKIIKDNPDIITINELTLTANFSEGYIYIQYYGLPMDEDGQIDIPETKNGSLETYLEYHVKRRLAERLLANGDAQGLSSMYQVYASQEEIALRNATNEVKSKHFTMNSFRKIAIRNRIESSKFDINRNYQWQ